jgi:hypothetical protein
MKLNRTNIDENDLSSDVVFVALTYFLKPLHPSLKYAIQFVLIDTPKISCGDSRNWSRQPPESVRVFLSL